MNTKADWPTLKRQWIAGDMSLRAHARANDVVESSMVDRARKDGWAAEREKYRLRLAATSIESLVQIQADDLLRTRGKAIMALEEGFDRFRADLKRTKRVRVATELDDEGNAIAWELHEEPALVITPTQFAHLIDRVNVLMGQPASITRQEGESHVDITTDLGNLPAELLAGIAELGRTLGVDSGAVGTPALPRLADADPAGGGD